MVRRILISAIMAGLLASPTWAAETTPSPRPTAVSRKHPPIVVARTPQAARLHARNRLDDHRQFRCLDLLWRQESNWRPNAQGKVEIGGRLPGGIPQILGLDPKSSVEKQIERGLAYIAHRYGTPCKAWSAWKSRAEFYDGRWHGGWY